MDDAVRRIVERFELIPHPEGGYFREVYRSATKLPHPGIPAGAAAERATGMAADSDGDAQGGPPAIESTDGTGLDEGATTAIAADAPAPACGTQIS